MLNPFYECILIVLRTTNTGIYLGFRIFDAMFNYLEYLKKTIEISICSSKKIVIKASRKASNKLSKYYSKIEGSEETLYNLANILDSTQKLSLYKM